MKYYLLCILAILCFTLGCIQPAVQSDESIRPSDEQIMDERNGSSIQNAIPITGAGNEQECVDMEYLYFEEHLGERGKEWVPMSQELVKKDSRTYDLFRVQFSNLTQKEFYFDITDCF
ncbi:MAG TPA: hypothetical protein VMW63_01765 [Methanoregulaceae archaeon]|nr:hypothetical protein [Methanoregulaceae archaeon]